MSNRPATTHRLDYARPGHRSRLLLLCVIVGVLISIGVGLAIALLRRPPSAASPVPTRHLVADGGCSWRMRDVGVAIVKYVQSNGGQYPDSLEELVDEGLMAPTALRCPFATAASPQYIYVGRGLTNKSHPFRVVLYESAENHDGANILFADGHVESFSADKAEEIVRLGRLP